MKDLKLTVEQKKAIRALEMAIANLGKSGISICGIDDGILYATKEAIKTTPNCGDNYCTVADAVQFHQYSGTEAIGSIKTGKVYIDSGGW